MSVRSTFLESNCSVGGRPRDSWDDKDVDSCKGIRNVNRHAFYTRGLLFIRLVEWDNRN